MRTISIKGVGKAKRNPDLVIFNISTNVESKEYAKSIENSNRLVNKLKDEFEAIGFEKCDIKTTYYNSRPIYQSVEVGVVSKRYERVLEGYVVEHNLKVEFDLDNDRIDEVINCLKKFENNLTFDINFSVRDRDGMKRDVIVDATRNARFNAEVLAEASSVKLGDLIKIEYNWVDFNFISSTDFDMSMSYMYDNTSMDFAPEEIEITDNVSFVWEIKNG